MDMLTIDLTDLPSHGRSPVVLKKACLLTKWASAAGTVGYELLCAAVTGALSYPVGKLILSFEHCALGIGPTAAAIATL
jgi:hypothetical protein